MLLAVIATLATIGISIPITLGDKSEAMQIPNPLDVLSENPTIKQIKEAVVYVAQKYGLDESEFMNIIQCESSFIHAGQYGDGGLAYGVAQFHKSTFDRFCKGDYNKAKDQLICMAEMFQKGLQRHWTCYVKKPR